MVWDAFEEECPKEFETRKEFEDWTTRWVNDLQEECGRVERWSRECTDETLSQNDIIIKENTCSYQN